MKAFNPQAEDGAIYAERLQPYLVANGVEDAGKKRAILLTVCGAPTYKLLRSYRSKAAKWMRNLTTNWSSSWNHTTAPSHLRLCRDFFLFSSSCAGRVHCKLHLRPARARPSLRARGQAQRDAEESPCVWRESQRDPTQVACSGEAYCRLQ